VGAAAILLTTSLALAQNHIQTVRDVDPFTDVDRSFIAISANEAGSITRNNLLIWRCSGGAFEIFIQVNEYIGSNPAPVIIRFDDAPPISETWNISTSGTAVFLPRTGPNQMVNHNRFTISALESNRLTVGITDYRNQRFVRTFSLLGLEEALQSLDCVDVDAINQ
jgi:hypothetical protein